MRRRSDDGRRVKTIYVTRMDSPLGEVWLASTERGLCQVSLSGRESFLAALRRRFPDASLEEDENRNRGAVEQLREYFAGKRTEFDLPLDLQGTAFQLRVWSELRKVPYGYTVSYAELARRIGKPRAVRAVGQANHHNPVPIVVPCHRVVGSDGRLVGFGGGLELKKKLLELENVSVSSEGPLNRAKVLRSKDPDGS